jgi:hypothetical protein
MEGEPEAKLRIVDPLNFLQAGQQFVVVNRVVEDRDNPLSVGDGMSDFQPTCLGAKGVGADNEQEIVGGIDGGEDFRQPIGRVGNAARVNPSVARLSFCRAEFRSRANPWSVRA